MPTRSISTLCIRISNTNQKEGFIPLLNLKKGIYAGNAIVQNHGGKAYIKVGKHNFYTYRNRNSYSYARRF